ncbi:SpoIIE family protein phosphatase [Streptomyces sp. NPDC001530]|uniref:SpoIIE family protein phosphatase n=1 Tax=Streptomyces sp. NPDC001530 TaxID=3364582 RepID=UPI003686BE55
MSATKPFRDGPGGAGTPSTPGGLLDALKVAAVVLDADGRIVLWSPQAEELFGYSAEEALGQLAGRLLVHEQHLDLVIELFAHVMEGGENWGGVFPVRHKDGSTRLLEFRNMRLTDDRKILYALGLATDQATLKEVERDLALSTRLISQAPIGLAILDTDLRYVLINPALERINGLPADKHIGRHVHEALPFLDVEVIESSMRQVLATGIPLLDQYVLGRTPADPSSDHAWSVSYYRLEAPKGTVLGLAVTVIDVTERHRAITEAHQSRQRLAVIAEASVLVGTTLDLDQTARELADIVVPDLADLAAVDILDTVLSGRGTCTAPTEGPAVFRALAVKAAHPSEAVRAADRVGELAQYDAGRLVTQCVTSGNPVFVPQVNDRDVQAIARDAEAAAILTRAGLHSYLAVPLVARGNVLGVLDLKRIRNPLPFDGDDLVLARELAARAAVSIDNARWYQHERDAALTLQRSLLPQQPPDRPGLEIAYRYQPAGAASEVGGDWFDVIPLTADKTALVVGDVMGSGIPAAATMGQLSNAARALADLDLDPAEVLQHLDHSATSLVQSIATCLYAVYDPHRGECRISLAGHLPPALRRSGRAPELLDLPTGVPLGVGGVPFTTTRVKLFPRDQLVLYTDGLVETRDQPIDARLDALLDCLDQPEQPLEATCDHLLQTLRDPNDDDDVVLLIARIQHHPPAEQSHPAAGQSRSGGPA